MDNHDSKKTGKKRSRKLSPKPSKTNQTLVFMVVRGSSSVEKRIVRESLSSTLQISKYAGSFGGQTLISGSLINMIKS